MNKKIILSLVMMILISIVSVNAHIGNVPHAPLEIYDIEDSVVLIGETYTKQVTYVNNVGQVNFSLLTKPTGMIINETTGIIRWSPLITQIGNHEVTVKAIDSRTDGDTVGQVDTKTFTLFVRENVPNVEITPTKILFQGDRGAISNSVTVTIKNTGAQDLTNVNVEFLKTNGNIIESTAMSVSGTWTQTLDVNEEITLILTGIMPEDMDGGIEFLYGYVKFTADGTTAPIEKKSDIYYKTNSNLEIQKIEVYVNSDREETFKSSGKSFDELKDGDEIKLVIYVENLHDDNEMVDVFATLSTNENGWDEFVDDEESDEIDIDDGDEEKLEISFKLNSDDLDEDSRDYATFTLVIEGEDDETGYNHYDTWTFTLEIEREKDEISISNIRMTPATTYCTDSVVEMRVDYKNTGSNDQDEGRITISNSELNVFEEYSFDELESKESDDKTFLINIPTNLEEGNYNFIVRAYNEDDDETDEQIVTLESLCMINTNNDDNDDNEDEDNGWVINPNTNTDDTYSETTNYQPTVTGESDFRNSPFYITLLIVLLVLVIVGIVMLGILISKRN